MFRYFQWAKCPDNSISADFFRWRAQWYIPLHSTAIFPVCRTYLGSSIIDSYSPLLIPLGSISSYVLHLFFVHRIPAHKNRPTSNTVSLNIGLFLFFFWIRLHVALHFIQKCCFKCFLCLVIGIIKPLCCLIMPKPCPLPFSISPGILLDHLHSCLLYTSPSPRD